jgi:hypothetical protein
MEKSARELLAARPENRDLLMRTETIEGEATGSALIAEFKKLLFHPYLPNWVILTQELESGEKQFRIKPYKKTMQGLWYFSEYLDAKSKLRYLDEKLKDHTFAYRDGGKSKEEILKHNQKVETLAKDGKFPTENLIILGEGRTIGEKSLVLVRGGHVLGYGFAEASDEEIFEHPEAYITRRFFHHLGVNLATMKYLRVLKNLRQKNEVWRSLAEIR